MSNRSDFALSNTKLEVSVEPLDGQSFQMLAGVHLPDEPESQWSTLTNARSLAKVMAGESKFVIDKGGKAPLCHVRFGTLLPGETARSSDSLAVLPSGPGKLRIRFRVLAGELPAPVESDCVLEVTGASEIHGLNGLKKMLLDAKS